MQTSLQSYMYFQLKSFDPSLPDATISSQAGILQGAFTFTQFLTAMAWGRAADADWIGRKNVLLIGLLGTAVSSVGFGFSRSFALAVFFRCLGGLLNGNIGVMRTMIAEVIKEKVIDYFPFCFCLAVVQDMGGVAFSRLACSLVRLGFCNYTACAFGLFCFYFFIFILFPIPLLNKRTATMNTFL